MTNLKEKPTKPKFKRKLGKIKKSFKSDDFRARVKGDIKATLFALFGIFLIVGIFGASIFITDYLNAQNARAGYVLGIREILNKSK